MSWIRETRHTSSIVGCLLRSIRRRSASDRGRDAIVMFEVPERRPELRVIHVQVLAKGRQRARLDGEGREDPVRERRRWGRDGRMRVAARWQSAAEATFEVDDSKGKGFDGLLRGGPSEEGFQPRDEVLDV